MLQITDKRTHIEEQAELREIEVLLLDNFDEAILGLASSPFQAADPVVAYSTKKIIEILVATGLTRDEAYEHFSFNIEGSYVGPSTPLLIEDDFECSDEDPKEDTTE